MLKFYSGQLVSLLDHSGSGVDKFLSQEFTLTVQNKVAIVCPYH